MGRYFGTDGFRGEANNNLTADHAYKIGRFLGWYYGEIKRQNGDDTPARIVIGKDTRRSSYMFEYTLVGGLVASGQMLTCFMLQQHHLLLMWQERMNLIAGS